MYTWLYFAGSTEVCQNEGNGSTCDINSSCWPCNVPRKRCTENEMFGDPACCKSFFHCGTLGLFLIHKSCNGTNRFYSNPDSGNPRCDHKDTAKCEPPCPLNATTSALSRKPSYPTKSV